MKNNAYIAGATIITWLGIGILGNLSLLDIADFSFLLGIISLVICAIILIFESKFLTLFMSGFKKMKYIVFPQPRSSERVEKLIEDDLRLIEWKSSLQSFSKRLTANFGVSTLLVSLFCLAIYY
ncbi:DUF3899 domain-containing protein [Sporosarcina gallistercoris]|uniref:DUF3899 domain-containing protein n=1 Tax=Sporosarcina gallistercoris TaxID=2762245 RepID=UPI003D290565